MWKVTRNIFTYSLSIHTILHVWRSCPYNQSLTRSLSALSLEVSIYSLQYSIHTMRWTPYCSMTPVPKEFIMLALISILPLEGNSQRYLGGKIEEDTGTLLFLLLQFPFMVSDWQHLMCVHSKWKVSIPQGKPWNLTLLSPPSLGNGTMGMLLLLSLRWGMKWRMETIGTGKGFSIFYYYRVNWLRSLSWYSKSKSVYPFQVSMFSYATLLKRPHPLLRWRWIRAASYQYSVFSH